MKTEFSLAQLADPDIKDADGILRACVHCGFCTATCPTYLLTGDELDGPRGRIYLIKEMLESGRPAPRATVRHIDNCLSCLSCMTTCPSGVNYMHLVDHARVRIARTRHRPLVERLQRFVLGRVIPDVKRFRLALGLARLARPLSPILPRSLRVMVEMAPAGLVPAGGMEGFRPGRFRFPAEGETTGRVALMTGCVQRVLSPQINAATIRLLVRHGIEVVVPKDTGCCGALNQHLGQADRARALATANIDALMAEIEGTGDGRGLDAVIVNASGCGTTVKDYGHMFRDDPVRAEAAAKVSALARDVGEFAAGLELRGMVNGAGTSVVYQSACSLRHGQKIDNVLKELLESCGFAVRDLAEGHLCCGSAGIYNILRPKTAARLRTRKLDHIKATGADVVASGNIGCIAQLGPAADRPVLHTVELLDWATGGPQPPALARHGVDKTDERIQDLAGHQGGDRDRPAGGDAAR